MKSNNIRSIIVLTILYFSLISFKIAAQNLTTEEWNAIRNEAFYDFIGKGGTTSQWEYNSDRITQEYYRAHYSFNNSGQAQRRQSYVQGTFVGANGPVGAFRNGYVSNSMGQNLGYISQGQFINNRQQCVGYIQGSQIYACNGTLIASIRNNGVYDAQGYLIYTLNGETLLSQNYFVVKIEGIDMTSLAAYLLFF